VLVEYIEAFRTRDLPRCVRCYTEDAILEFGGTYYQDRPCLERWHLERFASNLALLRIDNVLVIDESVTIDGLVTSDRLKTWGIAPLPGRAQFTIRHGKIAEARFGLKAETG
jgi:hypothetical protein